MYRVNTFSYWVNVLCQFQENTIKIVINRQCMQKKTIAEDVIPLLGRSWLNVITLEWRTNLIQSTKCVFNVNDNLYQCNLIKEFQTVFILNYDTVKRFKGKD